MGSNIGIIRSLDDRKRDKKEKYSKISAIALEYLETKLDEIK